MTYNVFGGTLSLTQSINRQIVVRINGEYVSNLWNLAVMSSLRDMSLFQLLRELTVFERQRG